MVSQFLLVASVLDEAVVSVVVVVVMVVVVVDVVVMDVGVVDVDKSNPMKNQEQMVFQYLEVEVEPEVVIQ